jgi:hypothetical protein
VVVAVVVAIVVVDANTSGGGGVGGGRGINTPDDVVAVVVPTRTGVPPPLALLNVVVAAVGVIFVCGVVVALVLVDEWSIWVLVGECHTNGGNDAKSTMIGDRSAIDGVFADERLPLPPPPVVPMLISWPVADGGLVSSWLNVTWSGTGVADDEEELGPLPVRVNDTNDNGGGWARCVPVDPPLDRLLVVVGMMGLLLLLLLLAANNAEITVRRDDGEPGGVGAGLGVALIEPIRIVDNAGGGPAGGLGTWANDPARDRIVVAVGMGEDEAIGGMTWRASWTTIDGGKVGLSRVVDNGRLNGVGDVTGVITIVCAMVSIDDDVEMVPLGGGDSLGSLSIVATLIVDDKDEVANRSNW